MMRKITVLAAVSAIAVVFVSASSAQAFVLDGLTSGMSLPAVRELATARGWTVEKGRFDDANSFHVVKQTGESAIVQFCDGLLFAVSAKVPEGFSGFVAFVADLTAAHGNPRVSSTTSPAGFEPVIAQLELSWPLDQGGRALVTYGTADDLGAAGVQLSPSAVFLFDESQAICGQ